MATIKAHTDLEQSKKLAEILPLESADMCFANDGTAIKIDANSYNVRKHMWKDIQLIPCWSLAALLNVLPRIEYLKPFIDLSPKLDSDEVAIYYHSEDSPYIVKDNLIDACYELIIELHEHNLL